MDREKYTMLSIRVAKVCIPTSNFPLPTSNFPLFLTSANLSGHPESKTLTEARVFFPSVEGIDGGLCDHPPSDIFSL
jgi:tRNA A37 threonylcarbamoyladenosine synthetase subunit TsaC/SUA5/YrdC